MPGRPDLQHLKTLTALVTHKGISGASRASGTPKSTLSRHLALLEAEVGAPLVDRESATFALTEDGRVVHQHAVRILRELSSMMACLGSEDPSGLLRVSTTYSLFMHLLAPVLPDFLTRYPDMDLHVEAEAAHRDLTDGQFDLALRGGPLSGGDLIARRLGRVSVSRYAHQPPAGIAGEDALLAGLSPRGPREPRPRPRITLNDPMMVKQLVLAGFGTAWLPDYICRKDVHAGRLVRTADTPLVEPPEVFILYRRKSSLSLKARAFIDYLAESVMLD